MLKRVEYRNLASLQDEEFHDCMDRSRIISIGDHVGANKLIQSVARYLKARLVFPITTSLLVLRGGYFKRPSDL